MQFETIYTVEEEGGGLWYIECIKSHIYSVSKLSDACLW